MEKLYSLQEASRITDVPISTIRLWIEKGDVRRVVETESGQILVNLWDVFVHRPTVVTFYNNKGGPGKTSMSMCFADYLSTLGIDALLVDLDPQANLSQTFIPFEEYEKQKNLYDFFINNTPLEKVVYKYSEHVDILPADDMMDDQAVLPVSVFRQRFEQTLRKLFKKYSVVIIDLPPGMVYTYVHFGLYLADRVVIPVVPDPFSFRGINRAIAGVDIFSNPEGGGPDKHIVLNMVENPSPRIQRVYVDMFRNEFGDMVLQNELPKFTPMRERIISRSNLFEDSEGTTQGNRFTAVFNELLTRIYKGAQQ